MSRAYGAAAAGVVLAALLAAFTARQAAEVTLTIRHSRFEPGVVTVPAGTPVTVTLVNLDPIDHEWIVGAAGVHERHRTGTEPVHDHRPTEVSLPALDTVTTVVTFAEPGTYQMICHLPGHEAYGMVGEIHAG